MSIQAASPVKPHLSDSPIELLEQRIALSVSVQGAGVLNWATGLDEAQIHQLEQSFERHGGNLASFGRAVRTVGSIDPIVLVDHNATPLLLQAPASLAAGLVKSGPGTLVLGNVEPSGPWNPIFNDPPIKQGGGFSATSVILLQSLGTTFFPPATSALEAPRLFETILSVSNSGVFKSFVPKALLGHGPR